MSIGQNTVSSDMLRSYVERIEHVRLDKKQLAENESAILADAKANGFTPSAIKAVVKVRAMKPHDRQESEALLDMYLHSLGMATEPPLFRAAGIAGFDAAAREQVVARLKDFVPATGLGDIIVNMGGTQVRLARGADGEVSETPVQSPKPPAEPGARPSPAGKADVPNVDSAGAEAMGQQYARDNRPVIDNPFPFGDPRRARFDEGWRREAGSDGMGGDE